MPKGIFKRKPFSDEHKRRLSEKSKGNKVNLGRAWTEEQRKIMSKAKKGQGIGRKYSIALRKKISGANKGENNHNWQGGISPENRRIRNGIQIRLWREATFARDNFTCQKYGIRGGKLVAHHINNFAEKIELRFAIDNGITLSEKAHIEFHKAYGFRDNTREQLEEYLGKTID